MTRTRGTVAEVALRSIVLAAISVTLIGCKDVGRDLAACKVKAMEVYKPTSLYSDDRAGEYVRNCMEAAGYQILGHCVGGNLGTEGYTYLSCYE
jgi:hypothetical protein